MGKRIYYPPKIAEAILKKTINKDICYASVGDIAEIFNEIAHGKNLLFALAWYWYQAMKSIPICIKTSIYWRTAMIKNYLKIAYRNLLKRKL